MQSAGQCPSAGDDRECGYKPLNNVSQNLLHQKSSGADGEERRFTPEHTWSHSKLPPMKKSEFELLGKTIWFYGERFLVPLNYRLINSKFNS